MSATNTQCRLCLSSCNEFQSLVDDSGQFNEAYEVSIKYFDPMFLQSDQEQKSSIICIECWELIKDFHTFQEWIVKTQLQFRAHSSSEDIKPMQEVLQFKIETDSDNNPQDAAVQMPTSDISFNYSDIEKSESTISDCKDTNITQDDKGLSIYPNLFSCNICEKGFKSAHYLYCHKNKMHAQMRNVCYCKKSKQLYTKNETKDYYKVVCCPLKQKILKNDKLIAKWKSVLECGICKATFPHYSILRVHFKYDHPGEKFFIMCCERKLQQLGITVEHIRLHLDPQTFKCKICHLCYSAKSCLKNHLRDAHNKAQKI